MLAINSSEIIILLLFSQTVEKFFSKEIKYLVSNKREARYMRCLRQNSSVPDLGQSSPQPCSDMHQDSSNRDTVKKRCLDQTDTVSFFFVAATTVKICYPKARSKLKIFYNIGIWNHFSLFFCSWSEVGGRPCWRK